jgi:hypothetical protein
MEHNFGGRLFGRIPFMRKLNWREMISVRSVMEQSDANRVINASGFDICSAREEHTGSIVLDW